MKHSQTVHGFCACRRLQTSTSQSTKSLRLPHETHRFRPRLKTFCKPPELLRLPRILQRAVIPAPATRNDFEPQKTPRAPGGLTVLTSKSFSRTGVVQILRSSTSKNVPGIQVLNDFDFQIVLARRRGANFAKLNFQKRSQPTTV